MILADTGESQVFAHRDLVEMGAPGPDIDWFGDLQPLVDQRITYVVVPGDDVWRVARDHGVFVLSESGGRGYDSATAWGHPSHFDAVLRADITDQVGPKAGGGDRDRHGLRPERSSRVPATTTLPCWSAMT